MSQHLDELEQTRSQLLERLVQVGDMRRGNVGVTHRRCGKSNCACADPDHPGHGPRYRLTRSVKGRTESIELGNQAALEKARREVANYRRFTSLVEEIVEVSEGICDARPLMAAAEPLPEAVAGAKKKGSSPTSGRSSRRR